MKVMYFLQEDIICTYTYLSSTVRSALGMGYGRDLTLRRMALTKKAQTKKSAASRLRGGAKS